MSGASYANGLAQHYISFELTPKKSESVVAYRCFFESKVTCEQIIILSDNYRVKGVSLLTDTDRHGLQLRIQDEELKKDFDLILELNLNSKRDLSIRFGDQSATLPNLIYNKAIKVLRKGTDPPKVVLSLSPVKTEGKFTNDSLSKVMGEVTWQNSTVVDLKK